MSLLQAVARGPLGGLALASAACFAQAPLAGLPPPPTLTARPAAVRSALPAASAASAASQAKPHVHVIEDDNVRIEESKVRGQTQRITVKDKTGAGRDYEILVPAGGKDPSQDRGTGGQRAWSLFAF